jgi:DNA-binding CsgD family transcriptional regulator
MSTCHALVCPDRSGKTYKEAPEAFCKEDRLDFAAIRLPSVEPDKQAVTPRQVEIWKLYAEGFGTVEIAEKLGLSPKTVDSHREHLKQRTGARNTADLTRAAIALGLIVVPVIGGAR